jgi:hypothetical protein
MVELLCTVTEVHGDRCGLCFLLGDPNISLQAADNREQVYQPQQHPQDEE